MLQDITIVKEIQSCVVGGEIDLSRKYSRRVPRPGIEPGTPGSLIERHNHEAKRSGNIFFTGLFLLLLHMYVTLARRQIRVDYKQKFSRDLLPVNGAMKSIYFYIS